MGGCKAPITTFIVEPFVPHDQEFYFSIVSERLGCTISFSECGGIEIEENWDKVCPQCKSSSFILILLLLDLITVRI
jgi:succinyl-CoA synthetase beta subunit